ncbi:MAG: hypothetical protein PHP95_04300 [Desulfuromonadaceae bacterium]|nr:hypothetical protein [Desulfuromonadaceae bacterium]MDD2847657.1 hypothetical protein [Desulfuromonadaceae bacterium]MDD4131097.1 hypothetical protein [Desulfuromonadaceae bacterium]
MNFKKVVTIAAAAGALTALAIPAMAELTPYASVRLGLFNQTYSPVTGSSVNDTDLDLARNSRFGVRGTTGKIGGVVEMGLVGSSATSPGNAGSVEQHGVYTRLIYGTYAFDAGTLLVGQDYSNNWVASAQVALADNGFSGYGALDNKRQPQIKFTMKNGLYGALIAPTSVSYGLLTTASTTDYKVTVPELNVGYKGKVGDVNFNVGGLLLTAKTANTGGDTMTAYLGYADAKYTAGPASVLVNFGYGQNTGNMGIASGLNGATNVYKTTAAVVGFLPVIPAGDVKTIEGFIQGGYAVSDMVAVNAGFGYVSDDKDGTDKADARYSIFVNAPITVAKGFSVTPEFDYFDELKDNAGNKQGNRYVVGAKLQMDF